MYFKATLSLLLCFLIKVVNLQWITFNHYNFYITKIVKDLPALHSESEPRLELTLMPLLTSESSTQEISWSIAHCHLPDTPHCHTPTILPEHSSPTSACSSSWARQHQRLVWQFNIMPTEKKSVFLHKSKRGQKADRQNTNT